MPLAGAVKSAFKSTSVISWKPIGRLQQTVSSCIERTGTGLHSGKKASVRIIPELAGKGRYFEFNSKLIQASIEFVNEKKTTPLCTTICKDGYSIKTVEHLLSALEATGVDNCRIEVRNESGDGDDDDRFVEIPILDGSAKEWVEGIQNVGLKVTNDIDGNSRETLAPFLNEPVNVWKNDSFIAAFPYSPGVKITYGIDFPHVPAIGCQWFSCNAFNDVTYVEQIASSRTFCIYEEVEKMRDAGLIKGGSGENAIVCSSVGSRGWLNPPLRFDDEPCRHKVLDLIGDFSLFARDGSRGVPVAHIVAYKGGHALHAEFIRRLMTAAG